MAGGSFPKRTSTSLSRKQINIGGSIDYGLGWFLRQWNGHKVVEHGGNIDGFNSQVAFMPDQKLGFVLLTNVTASPLGGFAMNTIWKNLVGEPKASEAKAAEGTAPASDPKVEAGKYRLAAAGVNFDVTLKDDKLTLRFPANRLTRSRTSAVVATNSADPAPPGYFATFRPAKDKPSRNRTAYRTAARQHRAGENPLRASAGASTGSTKCADHASTSC